MKRKLDRRKIRRFLGQAVIYISFNAMLTGIGIVGFLQNTIY